MEYLQRKYYVSLLSAAAFHGASHQQPQEFYVITHNHSIRSINKKGIKINFNTKLVISEKGIEERKTDTGYIKISDPELTALDLIQFESKIGGLNRVTTLLDELTEKMEPKKLQNYTIKNIPFAYLQRLGFILDNILGRKILADAIFENIKGRRIFRVLLNTKGKKAVFSCNNRWNIIENTKLESDL